MTEAADEFVFMLKERYDHFDELAVKESVNAKRSVWIGWRDATFQALQDFEARRFDMENGSLVPETEEPFTSLAEREGVAA